ncbi:nitric oxide reductase, NorB subunit apoprotein [Aequorivita viscosa]|uniref:Nitric oxide reductase, NorB subunit apoprotein n=2 Tax=Aequorivita viscosa TaxID=797419 RepID=A0A1M6GUQ7_9FLAO|nr:nitric oxide reductase, NorB subunit apoprotein [Aequorivita viscosa]SHJ13683.1 nitric oxide reductase, NorB subunit apoprotein [Aequorivita viscosa]
MNSKMPIYFLVFAIISLVLGMCFGMTASFQYVMPEFLKDYFPFSKLRPFHATSVIAWIILAATGSIYFFLTYVEKFKLFSPVLGKLHFIIFLLTGTAIYYSYTFDYTEGREYFAFPSFLMIPILIGWILFGINYFKTLYQNMRGWPVYYWMWGTGIAFMTYHLMEAHFWLFDFFRLDFIKDFSVQWKSTGSFTGSWNMLVYGISIYLMSKIKSDTNVATNKVAFFFYFLGLTNLMFGWAHHTYLVPTQPWIRYVAYGISMTEWIVLASIIYNWKRSVLKVEKENHPMAYRFLLATDLWVFLNIILALLFSIPAINYFTHGTHITVAHSMGTTIGINTTILFSALFFIIHHLYPQYNTDRKWVKRGFIAFNISLFLFCASLFAAGVKRSYWMYVTKVGAFSEMEESMVIYYISFFIFGIGIFISLVTVVFPIFKMLLLKLKPGK